MFVPKHRKIAFVHIHRTGGTTISYLLDRFKHSTNLIVKGHCHLNSISEKHPEYDNDFFIFSMVRNPWDRMLSWYHFFKANAGYNKSFLTFLHDLKTDEPISDGDFLVNQADYLTPKESNKKADMICRFENLEGDLLTVFERLELPLFDIPKLNDFSAKVCYRDLYGSAEKQIVSELCEKDINEFNYSF